MPITVTRTLSFSQFASEFRGDQFSHDALRVLYDYLDELDYDYELDVIALCCTYAESTAEEAIKYYGLEIEDLDRLDKDEWLDAVAEELARYTTVLGTTDDTVVYEMW